MFHLRSAGKDLGIQSILFAARLEDSSRAVFPTNCRDYFRALFPLSSSDLAKAVRLIPEQLPAGWSLQDSLSLRLFRFRFRALHYRVNRCCHSREAFLALCFPASAWLCFRWALALESALCCFRQLSW